MLDVRRGGGRQGSRSGGMGGEVNTCNAGPRLVDIPIRFAYRRSDNRAEIVEAKAHSAVRWTSHAVLDDQMFILGYNMGLLLFWRQLAEAIRMAP